MPFVLAFEAVFSGDAECGPRFSVGAVAKLGRVAKFAGGGHLIAHVDVVPSLVDDLVAD